MILSHSRRSRTGARCGGVNPTRLTYQRPEGTMSAVSLVKVPVAASNARGARIAIGGVPVLVKSVTTVRPGAVLLVGLSANGAEVSRVFPAGQTFAPVPTGA